jgi:DNA-binding transcriptional MerR regulator
MTDRVELPEKQEFFKLNEVCKVANVQPYMLRFWGTEFSQLETQKTDTGQRLYSREQVELILEIRYLLFEEGLTIAGARKRINSMEESGEKPRPRPKITSARKKPVETKKEKPSKEEIKAEVDKQAAKRVKPLVAALKSVRTEVVKIMDELNRE